MKFEDPIALLARYAEAKTEESSREAAATARSSTEDASSFEAGGPFRKRPLDGIRMALLADRVMKVEMRSRLIAEILDIRREALELTGEELAAVADRATAAALRGWEPGSERSWLETLVRLDERHARRLRRVRPDRNPWTAFLVLAEKIALALDAGDDGADGDHAEPSIVPSLARYAAERLSGEHGAWAAGHGADRALRAALADFERTRAIAQPPIEPA